MTEINRTAAQVAGLGLTALLALGSGALAAELETKELVVVSWGGSYLDGQREAYLTPFAEAFGVTVLEDTGPQIERSRAEVESGSPSFDITATNQAFYQIGVENDLWVPIDYGYFDKADLEAMPESVRLSHGVGTIYYAEAMAISEDAFSAGQPNSWKDFWDVEAFPGQRALPWCDVATYPLPEAALLADGVPRDQLYPIDMERAAKKLKALSEHVVWWKDANQPGQLLSTGEVVATMAPSGRIQKLIDGGAPLKIVWNEGRVTFDVWYVLKGAKNVDNAMRFLAHASKPAQQAKMAELLGYGPTNPRALELISEATARKLPNHPDNAKGMVRKDESWWKANRSQWIEVCTGALL